MSADWCCQCACVVDVMVRVEESCRISQRKAADNNSEWNFRQPMSSGVENLHASRMEASGSPGFAPGRRDPYRRFVERRLHAPGFGRASVTRPLSARSYGLI